MSIPSFALRVCLGLAVLLFGERRAVAESVTESVEASTQEKPLVERGVVLRASVQRARLIWLRDQWGEARGPSYDTRFHEQSIEADGVWGASLRGGYSLYFTRPDIAASLFLEADAARGRTVFFERTTVGIDHHWQSRPWYWSLGIGGEVQFLRRILGIGWVVGTAGVVDRPVEASPEGFVVDPTHKVGVMGRTFLSLHTPSLFGGNVGLGAFLDGFIFPVGPFASMPAPRGARLGLSAFFEWDGSRQ